MSNPTNTGAQVTAPPNQGSSTAGGANANLPSGHASLYVGDLDEDVTEAAIYEKFSQVGTILSIRVCRDMISRRSLGYAYVNLSTPAEAEKAIDALNFDTLNGRQMRIMWSQRDPSLRKSGVGNIFIKNLDKSIQVRELYDTFSTFGDILSCKIATDDKGVSKGYGFIHFSSKEAAETAIARLHGMNLKDKTIFVAPFVPRGQRTNQPGGDQSYNNVFIKNFGDDMTDVKLKTIFGEFGEITSLCVARNDDGSAKGFGFVCYKDPNAAKQAVSTKHGTDYNGRTLFVGRAMKKAERTEQLRNQFERKKADKSARYAVGVNLYVKNLEDNIDDEALRQEFQGHGNITSVKVMRDQTGRSKGFGFVCFSYPDEATKAVTEMNGKLLSGKPLYVALAQRKEERHARLQGEFMQRQMVMRTGVPGPFPANPLTQAGMNPHPSFAGAQMGPAAMNMYQLNALQANASGAMSAAGHPGFFPGGFPPRPMFPGQFANVMAQRQATQRWALPGTGLAGGPQTMRAVNAGYPQTMMRPPSMPPNAMQQQRFMPTQQATAPGFPQAGQPQQRPGGPAQGPPMVPPSNQVQSAARMPGAGVNAANMATPAGQVLFTPMARNLQQPQNPQAAATRGAPQPQQNAVANAARHEPYDSMPIDQFVQLVQKSPPGEQKNQLGERLYSMIKGWHPDLVGKLTGMLLEIDSRELLSMILEHHNAASSEASHLRKKVDSAYQVLYDSGKAQAVGHETEGPKKDGDSARN